MSKRFIGSEIWDSDWFLDLPDKFKILWVFINTKCDCAGIWTPNLKTVSRLLNNKYSEDEALSFFKNQVVKIKDKWFLPEFIPYQSGKSPSDKMIKPINNALSAIGLSLDTIDTVSIQYQYTTDTPIEIEIKKEKEITGVVKGGLSTGYTQKVKIKFLDCVELTEEEHKKLTEKFGVGPADIWIKKLNDYIQAKGKKYKSHYHTILMWADKSAVTGNNSGAEKWLAAQEEKEQKNG